MAVQRAERNIGVDGHDGNPNDSNSNNSSRSALCVSRVEEEFLTEIGYVSHTRGNKVICYSTVDKIPQSGTKIYVKELKAIGTVDKRLTKNGPGFTVTMEADLQNSDFRAGQAVCASQLKLKSIYGAKPNKGAQGRSGTDPIGGEFCGTDPGGGGMREATCSGFEFNREIGEVGGGFGGGFHTGDGLLIEFGRILSGFSEINLAADRLGASHSYGFQGPYVGGNLVRTDWDGREFIGTGPLQGRFQSFHNSGFQGTDWVGREFRGIGRLNGGFSQGFHSGGFRGACHYGASSTETDWVGRLFRGTGPLERGFQSFHSSGLQGADWVGREFRGIGPIGEGFPRLCSRGHRFTRSRW